MIRSVGFEYEESHVNEMHDLTIDPRSFAIFHLQIASPANCLHLTIFLIETIDHLMNLKRYDALVDFQIYLIALLPTISDNCHDPRPLLNCIQQTHEECPEKSIWTGSYFNYLLITLAELLHIIPSFYLPDALRLIKVSVKAHLFDSDETSSLRLFLSSVFD